MTRHLPPLLFAVGASLSAGASHAQAAPGPGPVELIAPEAEATPPLSRERGMVMLDYEVIPVPGLPSIDLAGFHFFKKFDHGVSLGVGGYAPLLRGDYGGFMTFDVTAHIERPITDRWFANAGVALGGGGGGKSAEQSKVLSGTGGYAKVYGGIGYAFDDFSVGLNLARFRFTNSVIAHTQPNLFVQIPFSYTVGSYASSGLRIANLDEPAGDGSETTIRLGLDNLRQRHPQGSNKGTINLVNLQYSRYYQRNDYWFFDVALGYRGLPLYNQIVAGLGRRVPLSPSVNLVGQLGIGSGGYAPDTIDTGSGLLVYPKVGAEVMLTRDLGVTGTVGYLVAPRGSSKNLTVGAALNYRIDAGGGGPGDTTFRGYRFHLLKQTELNVEVAGRTPANIQMLTLQIDMLSSDRFYIPVQGSVATNAYVGYPGYGEVLVGAGLQSRSAKGDTLQLFGQLLAGPNVHGLVLKPQVGASVELSDTLALHAQGGRTVGIGSYGQNSNKQKFRANDIAIGLSYRFSVPSR